MSSEKSVNPRPSVLGKIDRPLAKDKKRIQNKGQNKLGLFMARESLKFLLTLP